MLKIAFSCAAVQDVFANGDDNSARQSEELWEIAGRPYQNLPPEIVMSPEDMVDAALAGLDLGELITIPPLHDNDEWIRFESSRRALSQRFGNSVPAPRYGIGVPASALSHMNENRKVED